MKESWNKKRSKIVSVFRVSGSFRFINCHVSKMDANQQSSREEPRFTIDVFSMRLNLPLLLPGVLKVPDIGVLRVPVCTKL